MPKPSLRVVSDGERAEPMSLLEAVEKGDVLEMLRAQRRLIAEALVGASDSTRPQLNNELNKLHALIAGEESRRASEEEVPRGGESRGRRPFDAAAI